MKRAMREAATDGGGATFISAIGAIGGFFIRKRLVYLYINRFASRRDEGLLGFSYIACVVITRAV